MERKRLRIFFALIVMLSLLVGCASRNTSSESSAAPAAGETSTLKSKAIEKMAEFRKVPEFPGPVDGFDPGTGRAEVIACGFAADACKGQSDEAVKALKTMGWDVPPAVDAEFSPQIAANFLNRAVQQDLDGVILISIDVDTVSAAAQRAIDAGLTIVCTLCSTSDAWKGKVHDVTVDWNQQGQMAAWAILGTTGDNAKVVSAEDPGYRSTVMRSEGMGEVFSAECPTCTFERLPVAAEDISKPGPPYVSALLAKKAKGDITNLQLHYDDVAVIASKTVKQANREEIGVASYNGSPVAVAQIMTGKPAPYASTIGHPGNYAQWAAADLLGRLKAGKPLWEGYDKLPNILIDKENGSLYANDYPAPKGDWRAKFTSLWGK